MRALLIELAAEGVEAALLRAHGGRRWSRRFGFESSMHALVASVFLRLSRLDQLRQDAEAYPPSREARQSGERIRSKGHAIVGANELRQPELVEESSKHGLCTIHCSAIESLASEQIAAVAVGDREWIAVATVAHAELSFEIGAPNMIGSQY